MRILSQITSNYDKQDDGTGYACQSRARERAARVFVASALVLYLVARIWLLAHSEAMTFVDTATYDGTYDGTRVECDFDFWTGIRPFVVPVVHSVLRHNLDAIVVFQSLFGTLAWALLALSVAAIFQCRTVGLAAMLAVLGLGVSAQITVWDQAMLSESLAYSLQALLLAAVFWFIRTWSTGALVATFGAAFLWVFTRDSHLYYLLLATVALAPLGALTWHRWRVWSLCAMLLALFLAGDHLASTSLRWVGNFDNVLAVRIMSHPDHIAFLEARGLPVTGELKALKGKLHTKAMHGDSEFKALRAWTFSKGKGAYTRLLLAHPRYLIGAPLRDLDTLMGSRDTCRGRFKQNGSPSILTDFMNECLYPVHFGLPLVLLALFWAGGASVALARGDLSYITLIPIALVLLSFPHAMLIWHGDTMELERHALMPALQIRIGFMIGLLLTLDAALARWKRRARTPGS